MMQDFATATFVFVSSRTGPVMGRVERRLIKVMAALVERKSTVLLICTPRSPLAQAARDIGVEVAPYHLDRVNVLRTASRVRSYLRRHGPIAAHSTGLEADLIVRMAARDLPTAAINSITCADWPRAGFGTIGRSFRRRLDLWTLSYVDAVVTDCAQMADSIVEAGVARDAILIDPPTVDLSDVQAQAAEPIKLPPRPAGPLVGYGGRIEATRGLEHLVAASAILEARGAIAEVVIAGEGPILRSLQSSVRSSRVRYLGWVDSVPAAIKQFAVAVFPSTAPGVPTGLLEAAALGRPIVASRIGGIDELFEEGREIVLVEPGDPRELASAIAALLEDPEEAAAMGERARVRTVDEYSSGASIERHLALYSRFMRR